MIKKLSFSYKKDGRLNGCRLNLSKDILAFLSITEENNNIIFEYKNDEIIIKHGKTLVEQEQKTENGKILLLIKNYKIKFDKVGKYKSPKLVIPLPVINSLGLTINQKSVVITLMDDAVSIKPNVEGKVKKKGKVYTIKVNKGGVGKTFLTVQLSVGLSLIGKKVLILTSDSQNNVLDYTAPQEHKPIFNSGLKAFVKGDDGDIIRIREHVDFIPLEDSKFSTTFLNNLPKFIEKMKTVYDFILIDSIPTMKLDTIFVECSDKVIIPCFCDRVTVEGVINVVEEAGINKIYSIIVNKYRNTANQNKYLDDLKNVLGETTILLPKPIKELSQIETLLEKGKSIWETNSKGLQEVQDSLIEVIKGM